MTAQDTTASATAETAEAAAAVSGNYKWYALGVLMLVYIFNFVDRQILAILQESIKNDLDLSDSQLGLIGGFAFALFYATLGIPIARLADRYSRAKIIALALATWSAMTALCGMANSFATLALARIGVGVGEAGCSPPAHSLISDFFEQERRATALSIYALGIPIGVMFGYLAGGWINEFFGWRIAFMVVGLPGVLLAVFVYFFLREPPRGMSEKQIEATAEQPAMMDVFHVLWSRRSFRHMSIAAGLHAFVGYGAGQWLPSYFQRVHEMPSGELGTWLALLAGIMGGLGTFLGGYLTDKYGVDDKRWYMWIPGLSLVALTPFVVTAMLIDMPRVALLIYAIPAMIGSFYLGPTFSMTQSLVSVRMRAVAAAVLLFILNLIGLGAGPALVGFMSDLLEPTFGIQALRYALLIAFMANLWSALHYFIAAKYIREDLIAAQASSSTPNNS